METISFVSCTIVSVSKSFPSREGQHSLTVTTPVPTEPGLDGFSCLTLSSWNREFHPGAAFGSVTDPSGVSNPDGGTAKTTHCYTHIPFITNCCSKGKKIQDLSHTEMGITFCTHSGASSAPFLDTEIYINLYSI